MYLPLRIKTKQPVSQSVLFSCKVTTLKQHKNTFFFNSPFSGALFRSCELFRNDVMYLQLRIKTKQPVSQSVLFSCNVATLFNNMTIFFLA